MAILERLARRRVCALLGTAPLTGTSRVGATSTGPVAATESAMPQGRAPARSGVPVLVYHRFASEAIDAMTITLGHFEAHLRLIERLGCTVVPLADVVDWRLGRGAALPVRPVALTADDGHRSQAQWMVPTLRERGWPATLFVYPSAISNAAYAMRWEDLAALASDGRFSVQSHTLWHPDLGRERRALAPERFRQAAQRQLCASRQRLEHRLGRPVKLLAWPFGIDGDDTWALARDCGYEAAFALGNRALTRDDPIDRLPRHLIVDAVGVRELEQRLRDAFGEGVR